MEFSSITSMIINKGEQKQKTKHGKVKLPPKKQTNEKSVDVNLTYITVNTNIRTCMCIIFVISY